MDVGYPGDGRQLAPGATQGGNMFQDEDLQQPLAKGPSKMGGYHKHPARDKAKNMEKVIFDQIEESDGESVLRNVLFEISLYGTGILKGPFNYKKTVHKWDENRQYLPEEKKVPKVEFVSIWDSFPDPRARDMGMNPIWM